MRLPMPSAMPAELAERMSDVAGPEVSEKELKEARDDLIEKLVAGYKVGSVSARGIFDAAMDVSGYAGYHGLQDILANVLALDARWGADLASEARDLCEQAKAFIERYVDAHPDMIEERAAEIAGQRREDAQ